MRKIKLKTKYKHFKNNDYMTLCISNPVDAENLKKIKVDVELLSAEFTEEQNYKINIYKGEDNKYYHLANKDFINCELVIYISLYHVFKIYARPYKMFNSKVDKIKYPDVEQIYRFEEYQ